MSADLLSRIAAIKEVPFGTAVRAVLVGAAVEAPDSVPGWVCCPIHGEKTPSLILHADYWYCHGACKAGGDALDLLVALEGLTLREAVARLEPLLGLSSDAAESTAARARALERGPSSAKERETWTAALEALEGDFLALVLPYLRSPDPVVDGIASGPSDHVLEELRDLDAAGPPLVSRARRERLRELRAWALDLAAGIARRVEAATGRDRLDAALAAIGRDLPRIRREHDILRPLSNALRELDRRERRRGAASK